MVMLCSLLLRWQLVATGDATLLDVEMAFVRYLSYYMLRLRWQLVAGGVVI